MMFLRALLVLLLLTDTASAHAVGARFGDYYAGLLHPLTAFEHLLPILGICLLAGFQTPRVARWIPNMFGGIPTLAAMNNAQEMARPSPAGGRKGGRTSAKTTMGRANPASRAVPTNGVSLWLVAGSPQPRTAARRVSV